MDWNRNRVTELLKIDYPIFQAPMAGGATTTELVSETSNCGGLGNLGAGYMNPEDITESIKQIRSMTNQPFGVNIFVPNHEVIYTDNDVKRAISVLSEYKDELRIDDDLVLPEKNHMLFYKQQLEAVLKAAVPVCSFTFGIPDSHIISEMKKAGTIIVGTATNVKEALIWEESGADMIVVQGSEAGGHRGTFTGEETGLIGSMALIPQVQDAVTIPVIAAGGIMDGRGIAAALMLGAEGAQLGTAFLTVQESGINPTYKEALLQAKGETSLTKAFSGKMARGITNRFMKEMEKEAVLPFPLQNDLTGVIRKQAASLDNPDFLSLWAGQAVSMVKQVSVQSLMDELIEGTNKLLK
ncbi:NAD(P)H-dependent flavin oxidoreductase [Cytobacillus purgationiresistens]|uniref:Probable nitronate monooxygenase n=1 Tax=Cytobacillus purgationiresistens TaxID=863449 RepID=A0ABU0ANN8_9BACI|nr:nitronate monooxygenase [Cytobacillus purgationiresistens]MDQ0272908.1 nitronate monooxygenase [Cytobacillus purgationiresistens]